MTYTVQSGDTFDLIAEKYNIPLEELIRVNPGVNPYDLYIGQQIEIPSRFRYPPARERRPHEFVPPRQMPPQPMPPRQMPAQPMPAQPMPRG